MRLPTTMTAIEITESGGPEVLQPVERPVPEPGSGEILIAVAAAGVNRPDVVQRLGLYPPPPGASDLPGLEVAGEVAAVGEEVTEWKEGDRVCALVPGGGYAQYATAPAAQVLRVPAGLDSIQAAGIPETFFTVWTNMLGGSKGELDLGRVMRNRLTVTGSTLRPRSVAQKGEIAASLRERVWPLFEAGKIGPVIHQTFPLAEASRAHELMETSAHIGKIILSVE